MLTLIELLVVAALPAFIAAAFLRRRVTPPPGHALIVHGRRAPIVRGKTFVLPLIESPELVLLSPLPISVAHQALRLQASVHMPDDSSLLLESSKLLGGRSLAAIEQLARDTLHGVLAHVTAELGDDPPVGGSAASPERIEDNLRTEAEAALGRIGLELDTLAVSRAV